MINGEYGEKVAKLLRSSDYTVTITVVKKITTGRSVRSSKLQLDWRKAIKRSIGDSILKDNENIYFVSCQIGDNLVDFIKKGNSIIEELWKHVGKEDIFRMDITILPTNDDIPKSWIMVRN